MHIPPDYTWYDIRPQISHLCLSYYDTFGQYYPITTRGIRDTKLATALKRYPKLVESGVDATAALNFCGGLTIALLLKNKVYY